MKNIYKKRFHNKEIISQTQTSILFMLSLKCKEHSGRRTGFKKSSWRNSQWRRRSGTFSELLGTSRTTADPLPPPCPGGAPGPRTWEPAGRRDLEPAGRRRLKTHEQLLMQRKNILDFVGFCFCFFNSPSSSKKKSSRLQTCGCVPSSEPTACCTNCGVETGRHFNTVYWKKCQHHAGLIAVCIQTHVTSSHLYMLDMSFTMTRHRYL